jgi:hypothetical protein
MKRVARCLAVGLLVWWAHPALAEPAWTRDGNCAVCHTSSYSGLIAVLGEDGTANPNGHGSHKVFRVSRSQTKSLYVSAAGLATGDRFAFGLKGFRYGGVTTGATFTYTADCDWANWGGAPGTYSYNDFYLNWGIDPAVVPYDITVGAAAVYDYYDLIFMVAGRTSAGDLFYAEEHAYLQVRPPNPPPLVAISSPAEGAVIEPAPIDITITANASDPGGSVTKVEFFVDGNKINEDTSAPYSCIWPQVAKGTYALTAKATDNDGSTTTSAAVHVTVKGVPGDHDGDADVDQTDYAHVQLCQAGVGPIDPGCGDADLNGDNQVNAVDVSLFLRCMSGAEVQGDPTCLN